MHAKSRSAQGVGDGMPWETGWDNSGTSPSNGCPKAVSKCPKADLPSLTVPPSRSLGVGRWDSAPGTTPAPSPTEMIRLRIVLAVTALWWLRPLAPSTVSTLTARIIGAAITSKKELT